jgi:hypothetical protein
MSQVQPAPLGGERLALLTFVSRHSKSRFRFKNTLHFISAGVSFFAVVIGVIPTPKWDPTQEGLRHLTLLGWVALGLGFAALLASLFLTRLSQKAIDFQTRQRRRIQVTANAEVRRAIRQITLPFFDLFGDTDDGSKMPLFPQHIQDPDRLAAVLRIEIRSTGRALSGVTFEVPWADVLQENANRGAAQIDRAMQIYATYLEPEVLWLLSELRSSEFLVIRLQMLVENVKRNADVKFLQFPFPSRPSIEDPISSGYGPFWEMIRKLDEILV